MRENKQVHISEGRYPFECYSCEAYHLFGGAPCAKAGEENVDGLLLCEGHALEAKLKGQISCWDGMLFHIDLWSMEASRRDRKDVVRLLEVQRVEATSARDRACADLDFLRRSEKPRETWEHTVSGVVY